MSATAKLNRKKLVDVLMEIFLKQKQHMTGHLLHLVIPPGNDQTHHHIAEGASQAHGQVTDSQGPEVQHGQSEIWICLDTGKHDLLVIGHKGLDMFRQEIRMINDPA